MKRLQGFALTFQRMVTCTYHFNPTAAISRYGWKYQVRHYCGYANRLSCLFRLRTPPFTLQLNYFTLVQAFGKQNTIMRCSKFYASSDSFMTYTPLSLLESTGSETMHIQFYQRNTMKPKNLAKQTDSFKIKFGKNVALKCNCTSIFCLLFCR